MVTKEEMKKDIEEILTLVKTTGEGTLEDRTAKMILYNLELLEQVLDKPKVVSSMHNNNIGKLILTGRVYDLLVSYVNGKTSETETRKMIAGYRDEYAKLFSQMGIRPSYIEAVIVMKI